MTVQQGNTAIADRIVAYHGVLDAETVDVDRLIGVR